MEQQDNQKMPSEQNNTTTISVKNRETTIYAKSSSGISSDDTSTSHRKGSTSSIGSTGAPSLTQRLIDRGVAVPSSFTGLPSSSSVPRIDNDSSSPTTSSYDFDNYYGMSPFITPSFNGAPSEIGGPLYKSLRHRYEKEKVTSTAASARILEEDEMELIINKNLTSVVVQEQQQQKKKRSEDSDIELSDEEEEEGKEEKKTITATQENVTLIPMHQRPRRSRSPLAYSLTSKHIKEEGTTTLSLSLVDEQEKIPIISPTSQKLKTLLLTKPSSPNKIPRIPSYINSQPGSLPNPPRRHLFQTPVFQVINTNTVKDRYLFLFNDLLLICKPIMDETMIVSSSSTTTNNNSSSSHQRNSLIVEKNRYRFRPNENSLFQVKNIVPLNQLTLYISKDDDFQKKAEVIEMGSDGRPILPPAKRIHPMMASALRKFETNANLGIQYLVDKGVLTHDPLAIANFLFKTPDLNRRQLGYYLSDSKNSDVYDAFLECFRLVGLRLDEALRILLTTFRLPSNWESLEYLIERFAKKWHDANQNVIKFHEDMVVKVVVAMLFLNAECWYDATSERDVFWYARELKERQDRQAAKRKMSVIGTTPLTLGSNTINSSTVALTTPSYTNSNRQSVTLEPLHYISQLRAIGQHQQPSLEEFLSRWNYYDQYELVPHEFMEEMYKSILEERLETGWDNSRRNNMTPQQQQQQQGVSQDVVITVTPYRLPTRLTKGIPSDPISISIPEPDKGLQIKLRGQDLLFEPNMLDFSNSCIQTFTITGNTLGRTSLMFIKSGEHAGNYVSPTLPRTKSVVVERPFMRYTFSIGFQHVDHENKSSLSSSSVEKTNNKSGSSKKSRKQGQEEEVEATTTAATATTAAEAISDTVLQQQPTRGGGGYLKEKELLLGNTNMIHRKYTFSVETNQERIEWLYALESLSGYINQEPNQKSLENPSFESRVALQVLKEVLLADEIKKGTARSTIAGSIISNGLDRNNSSEEQQQEPTINRDKHGRTMNLLLPQQQQQQQRKKKKVEDDTSSILSSSTVTTTTTTANVVTKRGYEIVKLVVQNSMVPLVLTFLVNQIS